MTATRASPGSEACAIAEALPDVLVKRNLPVNRTPVVCVLDTSQVAHMFAQVWVPAQLLDRAGADVGR